jgi:hypothetical protein
MPTCFAHLQIGIMGHATGLATIGQIGHFWIGQQLVGSTPAVTGCCPPGQANSGIGQATGFVGSHAGGAGTHWFVQVCPVQLPAESQRQVASPGGQVHVLATPLGAAQPHPTQVGVQRSPFWQSASVVQPAC